eukprot:14476837-Ditylum_brightwellii.AAC.2
MKYKNYSSNTANWNWSASDWDKITEAQWKGKVATWRENTTNSPSGRHLGYLKALLRKFAESPDTNKGQDFF